MKTPEVVAAASFGLLLGILVGMSASPVVASVVAAIIAAALAWAGITGKSAKDAKAVPKATPGVVTAFCLVCSASALGGVAIRTHDLFGQGLEAEKQKWIDIGWSAENARRIVTMKALNAGDKVEKSVFFAAQGPTNKSSTNLAPDDHPNSEALLEAWRDAGEPLKAAAEAIASFPPDEKAAAILAVWHVAEGQ